MKGWGGVEEADPIGEGLWPWEEEQNTQISRCPLAQGPTRAFLPQQRQALVNTSASPEVTFSCSHSILSADLGLPLCWSHQGGFGRSVGGGGKEGKLNGTFPSLCS